MGFFNKDKIQQVKDEASVEKKHTILLVDDEEANLRALSDILEKDYNILTANDGQEALELVQNKSKPEEIHLIISDQRMPRMNGVEFLKNTIPVIPKSIRMILTGFTDVDAIINSINEGKIYRFLIKPFEPQEMRLTIKRALEAFELEEKNVQLVEELKDLNASLEQKVTERTAELEKAFQTIKAQQELLDEELEDARETQESLLPETLPQIPDTEVVCEYEPMIKIGGDFYNAFHIQDQYYGLMIADVTGHGPSAALISVMASGVFMESTRSTLSPKTVMEIANSILLEKLQEDKFVSIFYAIYDANNRKLMYTNGGHPPALVIRPSSQEIIPLDTKGTFIGLFPNEMIVFEEEQIQLQSGDKVLIYTDAVVEAKNSEKKLLGTEGLVPFLLENRLVPIQELIHKVREFILEFSEKTSFDDDFTVLGLEIS